MRASHSALGRLAMLLIGLATLAFGLWGIPKPQENLDPVDLPPGLDPDQFREFAQRFAESERVRVEDLTLDLYRRVWVQAVGCWLCLGVAVWQLFAIHTPRPTPRNQQLPHPPWLLIPHA